jgi:cytochrome c-type biogenesis protein CcmH
MTPSFRRFALALMMGALLALPAVAAAHGPGQTEAEPEEDFAQDIQGNVPGASVLEGRLMAPCCWMQTIDIHDSPMALGMKREIRRRLRNGESSAAIQASFVDRYGPKILAVQSDSHLQTLFVGLSIAMAGAVVAAVFMIRRWRKQGADAAPATSGGATTKRDEWDDQLDAELGRMDG